MKSEVKSEVLIQYLIFSFICHVKLGSTLQGFSPFS